MYVTAQHVTRPDARLDGINAFCYRHGSFVWAGPPPEGIPDENPGELTASHVVVPVGGNRVRSYLDIIVPDEASWPEIRQAFIAFLSDAQRHDLPWVGVSGRCTFRVALESALAATWKRELASLLQAAERVHAQA
jgi:hypothetical protein